ncbi:DNA-binding protein [Lysobacter arvi]|uniref:DNA-binding protein n=1 Tax=Lysobacter arvi TaxID=3038776 RepID=A0ABU1C9A2_9GAMM|nr:DNA-binding protein [Lysobacter arvi]MDR0181751.1 DNA-binding protein [Lysobacter arvi]
MPQAPHKEFSKRLHQAWDYAGFPQGRHRTTAIADHYEVSRESARKWALGLSIPSNERLRAMAVQMHVSYEWLSTGRGTMDGKNLVRETPTKYDNPEEVRLVGLVRKLPRKKQRALIQLLEET